jgi:hypothetical protein
MKAFMKGTVSQDEFFKVFNTYQYFLCERWWFLYFWLPCCGLNYNSSFCKVSTSGSKPKSSEQT